MSCVCLLESIYNQTLLINIQYVSRYKKIMWGCVIRMLCVGLDLPCPKMQWNYFTVQHKIIHHYTKAYHITNVRIKEMAGYMTWKKIVKKTAVIQFYYLNFPVFLLSLLDVQSWEDQKYQLNSHLFAAESLFVSCIVFLGLKVRLVQ